MSWGVGAGDAFIIPVPGTLERQFDITYAEHCIW